MLKKIRYPNSQKGQVTLLVLASLLVISTFTFAVISQGLQFRQEMRVQLAADAAVTSGAIWEARTYNIISAMNQGILIYMTLAFTAALLLLALMACAATVAGAVVCAPILASMKDILINTITNSWEIAAELSKWEREVEKFTPALVLAYAYQTGKENQADQTLPFPFLPEAWGGKHEDLTTLSYHTKDGGFEDLVEKIMADLVKKIPASFQKFLPEVLGFIDTIVGYLDMPDPLILDEDFHPRMKLGVLARKASPRSKIGIISMAQATVFLPDAASGEEDLYSMDWHVKLTPVDFHRDLSETLGPLLEHFVSLD